MERTDNQQLWRFNLHRQDGFSLIEVAIILIIVGLLVGLGAELIGPMTKRAKRIETNRILDAAVESLVSYGATNDMLPVTGSFSASVRNPNDSWTKPLYYVVHSQLDDTSNGGICGRKTTYLTVRVCPDTGCSSPTKTISHVAFMIISGGGNYNNQTYGTATITSDSSSGVTISVYETDVAVDGYASDIDSADPYDDLVRWITVDELRTKAGCVGPQLRIINNELPRGYVNSAYSATVFGDSGVPYSSGGKYRWCRQESGSVAGLSYAPDAEDSNCLGESETGGKWVKADSLVISGTPTASGSFNFTFFVRDDNDQPGSNDNIAQKSLVMTINPESGGGGGGGGCSTSCSNFRVWNNSGEKRDFSIGGTCREEVENNQEATTSSFRLDSGETMTRHSGAEDNCTDSVAETLTYDEATCADTDGDCQVNISGSDR